MRKERGGKMEVLYWLIAIAILLAIEIMTLGLTTIWFAAGGLVAFFTALAGGSIYLQFILFLIVSFVLILFTRPVAVKYFNKERIKTNVDAIVGREARVTQEINNFAETGSAMIGGQEWTARQEKQQSPEDTIAVGSLVTVVAVSGVKVVVRPKETV